MLVCVEGVVGLVVVIVFACAVSTVLACVVIVTSRVLVRLPWCLLRVPSC